jgi:esterase/lipase superfamily enzyme
MLATLLIAASLLTVSDRSEFWDNEKISKETQFGESNEAGVTVLYNQTQVNQMWEDLQGKRLLVIIHGFNNPSPLNFYHTLKANMENLDPPCTYDKIIGYVWPSYDEAMEYFEAQKNITRLTPRLRALLQKFNAMGCKVDVIAHSMGNRFLLEALNNKPSGDSPKLVENFFSVAPAVDNEAVDRGGDFYDATFHIENMFVFFSERDDVLRWFYVLPEMDDALGYKGSQNRNKLADNVQLIDCTAVIESHAGYLFSLPMYNYLYEVQAGRAPKPYMVQEIAFDVGGQYSVVKEKSSVASAR